MTINDVPNFTTPLGQELEEWRRQHALSSEEVGALWDAATNGDARPTAFVRACITKKTSDRTFNRAVIRLLRGAYVRAFAAQDDKPTATDAVKVAEADWWRTSFLTRLVPGSWVPEVGQRMLGRRFRIVDVDDPVAVEEVTKLGLCSGCDRPKHRCTCTDGDCG